MGRGAVWRRMLLWLALIALLGIASYAGGRLWRIAREIRYAGALVQQMKQPEPAPAAPQPETPAPAHVCPVYFAALQAQYPDVVGWLTGCGGQIDTPLVQGADNTYYLSHLPDGTQNMLGTPFLDKGNAPAFTDDQTFVFGHHMNVGGGMFAPLLYYQEQAYYEANPTLTLHTPEGCYTAQVFSACVVGETDYPILHEFSTPAAFSTFAADMAARSDIVTDVRPIPGDRVLTLATCTAKTSDLRYVVCARLAPVASEQGRESTNGSNAP